MHTWQLVFIYIGRIVMGLVFLFTCVGDVIDRKAILDLMEKKKIPYREYLFPAGVAFKAVMGLGLLFNIYSGVAAFLLAVFMLIANVLFHNFWALEAEERKIEFSLFLVHMGIVAGLIVLVAI